MPTRDIDMKWFTRILAIVGLYYGGLLFAGSLGIGHAFFYYGYKPIQIMIDKDGNKFFVVGAPSYNELESTPKKDSE
jgi:hypothetical protein